MLIRESEGIAFIVAQADVKPGLIPLDQVIFEKKGLHFSFRLDDFEIRDDLGESACF